mgnify:CR=1 FL=1
MKDSPQSIKFSSLARSFVFKTMVTLAVKFVSLLSLMNLLLLKKRRLPVQQVKKTDKWKKTLLSHSCRNNQLLRRLILWVTLDSILPTFQITQLVQLSRLLSPNKIRKLPQQALPYVEHPGHPLCVAKLWAQNTSS